MLRRKLKRSGKSKSLAHRKIPALLEAMESRQMLAAHIAGNSTSYATIQAAVDAALPGAIINVDAGTYNETVLVNAPLTIRGAQAGVDARGTRGAESIVYATQTVFKITANDVTIDGFTIEGNDADIGSAQGAGVLMAPSIHGTHVLNNIIQNNVTGIYLSNNSNTDAAIIQHNLIQNNFEANNNWQTKQENGSRGIYTDGTVSGGYLTNVLIDSNTIYNFNFNGGDEDEGIIALQALTAGKQFNITISNNYWGGDSKALLATNVTNLNIIGNTITGTVDGSSGPLRFEGNANNVNIQYNTITGNGGPGVAVDDSGAPGDNSGFVINNNNIYGNNENIGFITQASLYNGVVIAQNDWWGSASGPAGDGPGTGAAVWANGTSGHSQTPTGLAGGYITFSPWATSLINIANIPVPAAASGLTVTPAAASQLTLNWTAPSSTTTNQIIQRSTDGVNFTTLAVVPALLNTYSDTGLTSGTTYTYRIITSNPTGNGPASNTAASAPPAYQPPVPASGITATSTGPNSIAMQWNVPYYPYGITNYNIYRNGVLVGTSATTSFTDTGLTSDTAYTYTVTTIDTTSAVSSPSAAVSLTTGHSQFLDPSFEFTPAANVYDPVTANWTFTGKSAIEYSGGTYGTVSGIPNGTQFAVIQGIGGSVGAISQTLSVNPSGAYTISFAAAQRAGYSVEPVTVKVDGTLIGTFTPTSTAFATFTTQSFNLTAGTHTVTFSGTQNQNDYDSFIDTVSLNRVVTTPTITALATAGQFQDASFEQTHWSYTYDPATTNWLFTGNSAIAANGTAFGAANAPDGTQSAFLQGHDGGTLGTVTQTVAVTATGQYTISFAAAQRANYGLQPIAVIVDGLLVSTITPTSTNFATYTTSVFNLTAGSHKFTFAATINTGDCDSFIDTVSLNHVSATGTPNAPVLLTASGASSTSVNLYWSVGGPGVTGYAVLRTSDGVNWTTAASGLAATTTSYIDTGLTAATSYYYMVVAISPAGSSPGAGTSVTTLPAAAVATPLSSLAWASATSGYRTTQQNASVLGNALTLHSTAYATGLGTSAQSVITYVLSGGYAEFTTDVGIDGEETSPGAVALATVDFQVLGDGKVLFDSGNLGTSSPTIHIAVPVTGVQVLSLVAMNGIPNSIDYDHADWAGANLISTAAQALVAPSNLTAVATSATQVNLNWQNKAVNSTGYTIMRSTDGVNFTTLAVTSSAATTTYSDTTAAASTTYYYQVLANAGNISSPASNTATAVTPAANAITTNLSTLNWTSATTGYGTVQKNQSVGGNTLSLRGVTYASGIGTHALSNIVYNINGGYTNFLATVGIDDEELPKGTGSVIFQVLGDGVPLFTSGVLTNTSPALNINVPITGVNILTLVATNAITGSIDYDHSDWAGARLLASATQVPAAPSGLISAASTPTQINLSWTEASSNITGFTVQRSTDGTNFTPIGTTAAGVTNYFDTTAAPATSYIYRVLANNQVGASAPSATTTAITLAANAVTTNISSIPWVSATSGFNSVHTDSSVSGNTLTLRGNTYATGLGTHAVSSIVYALNGNYTNFLSDIGIDDEENSKGTGSVDFQVIGDGHVLFDSGVLTNASPIVSLNVNVTGVTTLTLLATNGVANSIDYDHADWAGARLVAAAGVTPPAATPQSQFAAVSTSSVAIVDLANGATPSPWSNTIIGNVAQVGGTSLSAGSFTLTGTGAGMTGTTDSVDYAYQTLTGNGTIIAKLNTTQTGTGEAGVMIRESLASGARQVALTLGAKTVKVIQRAKVSGKSKTVINKIKAAVMPQFMKLVRKGKNITEFISTDGKHWKKVAGQTIKMNATVDIGLMGDAGNNTSVNPSVFTQVQVTGQVH